MGDFTYLPHTADIRMDVAAGSLEDLYLTSLRGMAEILKEEGDEDRTSKQPLFYTVEITSLDRTALLIDFLSDVLTAGYERHVVFRHIEAIKLSETALKARVSGYRIGRFDEDIKAVTYHEANVVRTPDGKWQTTIIFDI